MDDSFIWKKRAGRTRCPGRSSDLASFACSSASYQRHPGFRIWSKDERSSLRWFARQIGAKSQVIYLPIDPETQRKRVQSRFGERPDQTWQMSEEELTKWRVFFDEPDEAELHGTILPEPPPGYESWSAWAAWRWPSFPNE